jgi:hypothetical protein
VSPFRRARRGDGARGRREHRIALAVAAALLFAAAPASATWYEQGTVLTTVEENDLFVNTDRHYTQGFRQSLLLADGVMPDFVKQLADAIPKLGVSQHIANKLGFEIGQSIFTPANVSATQRLTRERPYAGWLYTGAILQRRFFLEGGWPVLENFQIDAGVIGPSSFAQETQTWVHDFRGFEKPRGWDNQLRDEPGVALKYQRAWLFSPDMRDRWLDLIPHAGLSLGNVDTSFRIGGTLRIGMHMPDDFGVSTISSLATTEGGWSKARVDRRWGFYVFTGSELSTVLYTAFLDGNLFRHSHHVEKEPFVAEFKAGVGFVLNAVELGLTWVYRTPQFAGQGRNDSYGSVSLKIKF